MKNLLRISLVLVAFLAIATSVQAVSSDTFVNYVSSSKTIAGKSVTLVNASQKAQIERYLEKNKISESKLDYLKSQFDAAVSIMDEAKVTDYTKLSTNDKQKIVNIANTASDKTGIKFTPTASGNVVIYNLDGTQFTQVPLGSNKVIKATGSSNYVYLVIPAVAIVAIATVAIVYKKRLVNAK